MTWNLDSSDFRKLRSFGAFYIECEARVADTIESERIK